MLKKILRLLLQILLLIIILKIVSCKYIEPYIVPYARKVTYINRYNKEFNIKIIDYFDSDGSTLHNLEWIRTNELKDDIIIAKKYDRLYENEIPLNIHLVGESDYVREKLVYDKSKGNHFEKIKEYLENHREEIFKGVLNKKWKNGIKTKFNIIFLHKIDDNKYIWYDNIYEIKDNILMKVENKDFDFDSFYNARKLKEKEFFKTKIKYEDIDWGKYIEYMEDYPVLIMQTEYKVEYNDEEKRWFEKDYWISLYEFSIDNRELDYEIRRKKAIQKIYKDIEKFYNKDTFTFVIRDNS